MDTFDEEQAIRAAMEVAGSRLGTVRLDSGDLLALAHDARRLLDSLGPPVPGSWSRAIWTSTPSPPWPAPVDIYGVGTSVVMGAGAPTAGFVYKLVARADQPGGDAPLEPVAKKSHEKATWGGRPLAFRHRDASGIAVAELPARALQLSRGGPALPTVHAADPA